jgi:AraC-like DNA-binding protein
VIFPVLPQNDDIFSYYNPHSKLLPYIAYYSIATPNDAFSSISPLFIPDLGGSVIVSRYLNDFELIVWGPFNRLTSIEDSLHEIRTQYFIEFQPGGLSRLIYPNSRELLNQKISMVEVDAEIHKGLKSIFEKCDSSANELVSFFDRYFLGLLEKRKDPFINGRHILNTLRCLKLGKTMNDLSKATYYSARHVNRYLDAIIGVSGNNYIRIKRFNNAAQILKNSKCSLEQISYLLGYYDISHFIHDFTELSGISPSLYRENVSDFYSESTKIL